MNRFLNIMKLLHLKQNRRQQREDDFFLFVSGNSKSVLMVVMGEQPKTISCNVFKLFVLFKSPIETIYITHFFVICNPYVKF